MRENSHACTPWDTNLLIFFRWGAVFIDLKRKDIILILETKSCSGVMLIFLGSIPEFAKYVSF